MPEKEDLIASVKSIRSEMLNDGEYENTLAVTKEGFRDGSTKSEALSGGSIAKRPGFLCSSAEDG